MVSVYVTSIDVNFAASKKQGAGCLQQQSPGSFACFVFRLAENGECDGCHKTSDEKDNSKTDVLVKLFEFLKTVII